MKHWLVFLFLCSSSVFLLECTGKDEVTPQVVNNRSCSIAIEGMMCEKGCKSTIQNKLSETEGVINCEVDFELQKAFITYDGNKQSADGLIQTVNSIADGIYTATLIEDKDIENSPVDFEEEGTATQSASVSDKEYSLKIPDFTDFFTNWM